MVERDRRVGATVRHACWCSRSRRSGAAHTVATTVRAHGGIAHRRHGVVDRAVRDDDRRVRRGHAAHQLAILRRFALTLLRQETTTRLGITATPLPAAWRAP